MCLHDKSCLFLSLYGPRCVMVMSLAVTLVPVDMAMIATVTLKFSLWVSASFGTTLLMVLLYCFSYITSFLAFLPNLSAIPHSLYDTVQFQLLQQPFPKKKASTSALNSAKCSFMKPIASQMLLSLSCISVLEPTFALAFHYMNYWTIVFSGRHRHELASYMLSCSSLRPLQWLNGYEVENWLTCTSLWLGIWRCLGLGWFQHWLTKLCTLLSAWIYLGALSRCCSDFPNVFSCNTLSATNMRLCAVTVSGLNLF